MLFAQGFTFERYVCARREKIWIRKNLRYCGVKESPLNVFRVMRNYAICMVDILRIPVSDNKKLADAVVVKGLDNLDRAMSFNQGVILVTGHIGNWDLAGVYLSGQGYPLSAVTEQIPGIDGFFNALRQKNGMPTFFPQEKAKILLTLENKRILALVSDRNFSKWGVRVKFLAGEKMLPVGPSALARKYHSPILVGNFVLNQDKKSYQVEISEPIFPANKTYRELTQMIADRLSFFIRKNPLQWFMLQDEWLG